MGRINIYRSVVTYHKWCVARSKQRNARELRRITGLCVRSRKQCVDSEARAAIVERFSFASSCILGLLLCRDFACMKHWLKLERECERKRKFASFLLACHMVYVSSGKDYLQLLLSSECKHAGPLRCSPVLASFSFFLCSLTRICIAKT